jgi:REP element-mobilizing transposase RayT
MARPWRIEYPGAVYHVINRGNKLSDIFDDKADRANFLEIVSEAADRFDLEVFAFCLMSNHYHLFFRTPLANLCQAMHWIDTVYTIRYNRRHSQSGHLFQGRYKSVLVVEDSHWLHLSMYIHLNPVRAGLVDDPGMYEWSSFRDYTRTRLRYPWLCVEEILSRFGNTDAAQRRCYRRECLMLAGNAPDFWDKIRSKAVLGPEETVKKLIKRYSPRGDHRTVPDFNRARKIDDIDSAMKKLAKALGVELSEIKKKKQRMPLRLIAYWHLVRNCGMKAAEVGRYFGVGTSAVSLGIKRLLAEAESNRKLERKLGLICKM